MKILYYDWNSTGQKDIIQCFKSFGIEVSLTTYCCSNKDFDEVFETNLYNDITKEKYDFIFSFNYFPVISRVCKKLDFKYVSWVFDSPHLALYSETVINSCNYIFIFDKYEYTKLKKIGVNNIFYMPLAVNVTRLDKIICTDEDKKLFSSDVSFVGSLYDKQNLYDQINYLPDYIKGYLDGIMSAQKLVYGYNFLEELLSKPILNEIIKYVHLNLGKTFFAEDSFMLANLFLGQKVTSLERLDILDVLSQQFQVTLYSTSGEELLPKVHHRGWIENEIGMPKVFKNSKINLNITLRSIQTGIPLRVFDIMGAGGFLITNFQQELYDFFEEGKDFVVYENLTDLKEKVRYYLEHDDERIAIAKSGHTKVLKFHTFEKRVEEMLKIIFDSELQ
jgi:spore maturation protein CgeB